jgi:hypothetical protein
MLLETVTMTEGDAGYAGDVLAAIVFKEALPPRLIQYN